MRCEDAEARQQAILAEGPRLEPLRPDELTPAALDIHNRIKAMANRDLAPRTLDNLPEVVGTMLRHPEIFARQVDMGLQVSVAGSLPPRDRELAVLRIGWLCGAPYEFGEHVHIARDCDIGPDDVAAVKTGSTHECWNPHDRAILQAVEELHGNAMISDATWAVLARTYDDRQLIELPMLVGHYQTTAYVQNSIRLRLHPGNEGLLAG